MPGKGPLEVTCEQRPACPPESENPRNEFSSQREQHAQRPWGWKGLALWRNRKASVGTAVSSQARRTRCFCGHLPVLPPPWDLGTCARHIRSSSIS